MVWSYRPKAVLSGLAAAWWHHLVATAPEIVDVTVGWQVLRFTRLDLVERPQRVLTQIRRAISARVTRG